MSRFRWVEPDTGSIPDSISSLGLIGRILFARGYRDRAAIDRFLRSDPHLLPDPESLPDMEPATARIRRAINDRRRIAIYGDYDVDGVTSTALLSLVLRDCGADVRTYLPHRVTDGYGLNRRAVRQIAEDGCSLLITVDCGTSNQAELDEAMSMGMEAIVVDHHHVRHLLDGDIAFISPKRPDSEHPFADYAAVGVSYQLARSLVGDPAVERYLPLVAVGTVADVVPLIEANRMLSHHGIAAFPRFAPPGLIALADAAGIDPGALTSTSIAFAIAPRLNAPGRIESPEAALSLLLTEDEDESLALARQLNRLNVQRQAMLNRAVDEAEAALASNGALRDPVLVAHGPNWHIGVVGLVASRLNDRYARPAIVFEQGPEVSRGSARSIAEFNVVESLETCRDLLTQFGGHSMAAGMTLPTRNLPEFRERINQAFVDAVGAEPPLRSLVIDATVDAAEISLESCDHLSALEPIGNANQSPCFMLREASIERPRRSKNGQHLLLNVRTPFGPSLSAVSFGAGDRFAEIAGMRRADIAFSMSPNTYRGRTTVSMQIVDFREVSPIRL